MSGDLIFIFLLLILFFIFFFCLQHTSTDTITTTITTAATTISHTRIQIRQYLFPCELLRFPFATAEENFARIR